MYSFTKKKNGDFGKRGNVFRMWNIWICNICICSIFICKSHFPVMCKRQMTSKRNNMNNNWRIYGWTWKDGYGTKKPTWCKALSQIASGLDTSTERIVFYFFYWSNECYPFVSRRAQNSKATLGLILFLSLFTPNYYQSLYQMFFCIQICKTVSWPM